MFAAFGAQNWWPAETPFEVVVGAVLTQNTAWRNVERAIAALRAAQLLDAKALRGAPRETVQECIRPAGFFRQKAERLQRIAAVIADDGQGDVRAYLAGPLDEVRRKLLQLNGIGPETADSILLYAGEQPTFVVDAYTMRIFSRLGVLQGGERYEEVRALCMTHLCPDVARYNEFHALLVTLAKRCCVKRAPRCTACPLQHGCQSGRVSGDQDTLLDLA